MYEETWEHQNRAFALRGIVLLMPVLDVEPAALEIIIQEGQYCEFTTIIAVWAWYRPPAG